MKPSECLTYRMPSVGDFVITFRGHFGIIIDYLEQYKEYAVYRPDFHNIGYYNYDEENGYIDFMVVTEDIHQYLHPLTNEMLDKLTSLTSKYINSLNLTDYDNDFYISLEHKMQILDDLYSNNLTRDVSDVIFSNHIKRVIKRDKKNGNRIIELQNGEIWKAHRYRHKTSEKLNRARKQYKKNEKVTNHTTYYKLVEKLS